jgi:hypothetical protein
VNTNVLEADSLEQLCNFTGSSRAVVSDEVTRLLSIDQFDCDEKMHNVAPFVLPIPNLVDDASKLAIAIERMGVLAGLSASSGA